MPFAKGKTRLSRQQFWCFPVDCSPLKLTWRMDHGEAAWLCGQTRMMDAGLSLTSPFDIRYLLSSQV